MPFEIIRNDITKVKADVIVNTANPRPVVGSGTDGAIYKAAGEKKLLAERVKIGDIARGEVAVTPAFKLEAKYIIHTVGPYWKDGKHGEFDILKSCYRKSLEKARELKCKSIAFPLIATGVYGFPKDKALDIALSEIQSFLIDHRMKIYLVVFDKKALQLSQSLIDNIREYIDDNYVDASESSYNSLSSRNRRLREREMLSFGELVTPEPDFSHLSTQQSIETLIAGADKTFQEKLFEIIDERGLTGPQVYTNYISRQTYSKLQSDMTYRPDKFTTIALCLSLHLNIDETQDLIGRAGWTLSPSSTPDLVIRGCIISKEYNLVKVNLALEEFGCPVLRKIK